MRLAVIPARGSSKRIPRKNIKPFCGMPMIALPITVAKESGCFDRVVVSTDDEEIARVARTYGAEAPFMRPAELSDDQVGTIPVVAHAVRWAQAQTADIQFVCCIYATAPFVRAEDLWRGLTLIEQNNADYAFSVTSFPSPIQHALRLLSNGGVEMFHPEQLHTRSQDLEEAYHDAAQFYWGRAAAWLEEMPIFSAAATPVVLPRYRVQDIDTPEDWKRAEWLFRAMRETS